MLQLGAAHPAVMDPFHVAAAFEERSLRIELRAAAAAAAALIVYGDRQRKMMGGTTIDTRRKWRAIA